MNRKDSRVEGSRSIAEGNGKAIFPEAVSMYLFPSRGLMVEEGICLGFEEEGAGFVCWENALSTWFDIDSPCLDKDAVGGLYPLLKAHGFIFYDEKFVRLEESVVRQKPLLIIGSSAGDRWFVFRKSAAEKKMLYCLADITTQFAHFRKVLWQKEHDRLTGLCNRESFIARCNDVLSSGGYALMVFLDMDDLKKINDNWGHKTGDQYLVAMAGHISSFFAGFGKERRVIGRLSGDEFAVCLGGFATVEARDACLQGLDFKVLLPLPDGSQARLAFTTGAARCPEDSRCINDLLIFADFAMNVAKKSDKGGVAFFSRSEHDALLDISKSQEKLRELLDKQAVSFVYVPYIDHEQGAVRVLEMFPVGLVRGLEDIDQLKIVSKHSYLLSELDRVIYAAMKEEFKKLACIDFPQPVTLGYMPQDLFYQGELEKFIQTTGFPSKRLTLCFDAQMRSNYERMKSISQARGLGIRFGFKEFGPKSSDAALEFRPDIVKLSKGLVESCASDGEKREMVKSLIELAQKFQFATAAGYIPSVEALSFLKGLGVNLFGGDAVHGAISLDQIADFLRLHAA